MYLHPSIINLGLEIAGFHQRSLELRFVILIHRGVGLALDFVLFYLLVLHELWELVLRRGGRDVLV